MSLDPVSWLSRPVRETGPFGVWGAPAKELDRRMACDEFLPDPDQVLIRATAVEAPASHLYRWLTQMRAAPYSYDWIDNAGKKSPDHLIEGADPVAVGQRIAKIFRLVDFEPDRSLTLFYKGPVFGTTVITYAAEPVTESTSRLFGRLLIRYNRNPLGKGFSLVLPAGDLVMMRRQMLNFAHLAAESYPASGETSRADGETPGAPGETSAAT